MGIGVDADPDVAEFESWIAALELFSIFLTDLEEDYVIDAWIQDTSHLMSNEFDGMNWTAKWDLSGRVWGHEKEDPDMEDPEDPPMP